MSSSDEGDRDNSQDIWVQILALIVTSLYLGLTLGASFCLSNEGIDPDPWFLIRNIQQSHICLDSAHRDYDSAGVRQGPAMCF